MLIAIDAHNLEGSRTGVGTYLFELLKEWHKMKISGQLAGLDFVLYLKNEIPKEAAEMKFFNAKLLRSPFGLDSNVLFTHYVLSKIAKKDKADLLFSPNYVLPIFYNGKAVLTIHDIIYEARPDLYNWPGVLDKIFLKRWGRKSAEKANAILVPSNFSKSEIVKHYEINPDKITVTPLAASMEFNRFVEQNKKNELKKKYGIRGKYILYVGSIFNRRHISEIIYAFKKIFPRFNDCQLVVFGANHTKPRVDVEKNIANVNGFLQNKMKIYDKFPIIYQKYVKSDDLIPIYKDAQALIYLSDYEGFGLPVLESMMSGVPVITSKQKALMETAGNAALFVEDNKNIEEIAEKMARVFSEEKLREELKKRGLVRANGFGWQKCAAQTLAVFKKVLGE